VEVFVVKRKLKMIITLICLISLVFTSTAFASISSDNSEITTLLQKTKDSSLTITEKYALFEKVEQKNAEAVKWFENLAINDSRKIKNALRDGIIVKNGEVVSIDFEDGSSIELSLETFTIKSEYLGTITARATYTHRVLGIPVAYYYIYCKYGFNSMDGPSVILDKWDESAQLYSYDVIKGGVATVQDNSNPVKVRGLAEIRQLNTTLANVRGVFSCYTNTDLNSCTWTVN
jgi:hypothetical protein